MNKYKNIYEKFLIVKIVVSKPFIFLFKRLPHFIKNVWLFRKELNDFYPFDWSYPLGMFRRSLELESEYIYKHGNEETDVKNKKINMMNRAVQIMLIHENDLFLTLAEQQLGYEYKLEIFNKEGESNLTYNDKEKNTALIKKSEEIEDDLWVELLDILDGQDLSMVKSEEEWKKRFDGSGFKTWWD